MVGDLATEQESKVMHVTNRAKGSHVTLATRNDKEHVQLPSSFRQPHSVHSPPDSPHPAHITSSQSPPSLSSPITASTFHSRLKTNLFHKSFPP